MFKNIIVLHKENLSSDALRKIEDIKKYFPNSNFSVVNYSLIKKGQINKADLVITFGGDGTFVRAGHLVEDSLILGINSNPKKSEGALTSLNSYELDKLKEISQGEFEIIERQRADVILNGKILNEKVINEIYMGAFSHFHTSRYKIKFRGKEEEQRSSGVIVSTGTGSEAWFLSAGGKPFNYTEKRLCFIVREPYFGKRVFQPSILNGEIFEGERLIIKSLRESGGIIAINDSVYNFNKEDVVEVFLSKKPLKVIRLKTREDSD